MNSLFLFSMVLCFALTFGTLDPAFIKYWTQAEGKENIPEVVFKMMTVYNGPTYDESEEFASKLGEFTNHSGYLIGKISDSVYFMYFHVTIDWNFDSKTLENRAEACKYYSPVTGLDIIVKTKIKHRSDGVRCSYTSAPTGPPMVSIFPILSEELRQQLVELFLKGKVQMKEDLVGSNNTIILN